MTTFREFLAEKGWKIVEERSVQHGDQVIVSDGSVKAFITFYDTGKVLVQGFDGVTKDAIQAFFRSG